MWCAQADLQLAAVSDITPLQQEPHKRVTALVDRARPDLRALENARPVARAKIRKVDSGSRLGRKDEAETAAHLRASALLGHVARTVAIIEIERSEPGVFGRPKP